MNQEIRVLIADDVEWVRRAVRKALEQQPNIVIVGEARNGSETIELVEGCTPDVLILDIEMPGLSGIQVIRALAKSKSPVKVLALSSYDDLYFIQSVLEIGASGYLTKEEFIFVDGSKEKFIEFVRRVANGEKEILSDHVAKKVFGNRKLGSQEVD